VLPGLISKLAPSGSAATLGGGLVALAVQVIGFGYVAWESLNRGYPIPVSWRTLLYVLAFCLLLALALSGRATTVLKLITMAAFAVLLVYLIVFTHYDVTGDARILAVTWIGFAAYFIDKAGWLVVVAGAKTVPSPTAL